MKHIILLSISMIIFASCNHLPESSGFKYSQPQDGKIRTVIPEVLYGQYRLPDSANILLGLEPNFDIENNDRDDVKYNLSHTLTINSDSINNRITGYLEVLKTDLNSSERKELNNNFVDSLILNSVPNPIYTYRIDSIGLNYKINVNINSNLFAIGNNSEIKEYRKKFYFNSYNEIFNVWKCYEFVYKKNSPILEINSISKSDFVLLKRLITLENDTVTFVNGVNPSKKTFKKFLKMNGFENNISLIKN